MRSFLLALVCVTLAAWQVLRSQSSRPAAPPAASAPATPAADPPAAQSVGLAAPDTVIRGGLDSAIASRVRSWPVSQSGYRRGGALRFAVDFHAITQTVDLRATAGAMLSGETVQGTICGDWADARPTVDLTGALNATIRDLSLRSKGGTALLLARRPDGASSGWHRFENVILDGPCIIEASECNLWIGCRFESRDMRPALTLRNGPPKKLGYTMQSQQFIGCQFVNHAGGPAIQIIGDPVAVVTDITFSGGDVACSGDTEAAVVLDTGSVPDRQMKMIHFANMRWETADRKVSIRVLGSNGVIGLTLRDTTFHQRESVVRSDAPLYQCDFRNLDCFPGVVDYAKDRYAIDAKMAGGEAKLLNARGYTAEVRP